MTQRRGKALIILHRINFDQSLKMAIDFSGDEWLSAKHKAKQFHGLLMDSGIFLTELPTVLENDKDKMNVALAVH